VDHPGGDQVEPVLVDIVQIGPNQSLFQQRFDRRRSGCAAEAGRGNAIVGEQRCVKRMILGIEIFPLTHQNLANFPLVFKRLHTRRQRRQRLARAGRKKGDEWREHYGSHSSLRADRTKLSARQGPPALLWVNRDVAR
jgi:hypothetical protein